MKSLCFIALALLASSAFATQGYLDQTAACVASDRFPLQGKERFEPVAFELNLKNAVGDEGGFKWASIRLNDTTYLQVSGESQYELDGVADESTSAYLRLALVEVKNSEARGVDFDFLNPNEFAPQSKDQQRWGSVELTNNHFSTPPVQIPGAKSVDEHELTMSDVTVFVTCSLKK